MRQKKIPMRKCVACQEMIPKKSLIRIVRTPESQILLDPTGKASGRGAYVCANIECFTLAKKRNSFERALQTKISDEIYDELCTRFQLLGVQKDES
ncbi:RNase P modulator RnpM [Caldalkalibacillus mannanilyticus]|uniref:RNase P modulator RnpM n=1 Tax=Caldalkalibacillus mannanilyticus TaxID=1418 RepID=UPI0004697955|nr:YlxR family protein [Caldalkalibacillus mannanilyticus]